MLVLTRRRGEKIRIGEDIEIEIVRIRGNQVRLGLAAPDHVAIQRSELPRQQTRVLRVLSEAARRGPPSK